MTEAYPIEIVSSRHGDRDVIEVYVIRHRRLLVGYTFGCVHAGWVTEFLVPHDDDVEWVPIPEGASGPPFVEITGMRFAQGLQSASPEVLTLLNDLRKAAR